MTNTTDPRVEAIAQVMYEADQTNLDVIAAIGGLPPVGRSRPEDA